MLAAHNIPEIFDSRTGAEYGQDLAAALIRAGRDLGTDQKREMSRIVLREITAAVEGLRASGIPESHVEAFERACRRACRDELLRAVRHKHDDNAARSSGRAA